MDKILEEAMKAGVMAAIGGVLYWVGKGLNAIAQTRTNNKDINRELMTLRQDIQERDRVLARFDKTLERTDDRLTDFDKRLTITEFFLPKTAKSFLSKLKGDSMKEM